MFPTLLKKIKNTLLQLFSSIKRFFLRTYKTLCFIIKHRKHVRRNLFEMSKEFFSHIFHTLSYTLTHPKQTFKTIKKNTKRCIKWCFATLPRKVVSTLVIISLLSSPFTFSIFTPKAQAAWWDETWSYRKAISISNTSGSTLTDFQVKVIDNKDFTTEINAGKIQSDLDDLRFTAQNGELLSYWIEDTTTTSVDVWVKVPSIPTSGATVYFYYGNTMATNAQNGDGVFEFFDDFSGSSLNATKWSATGAYSLSSGKITITTGSVYSNTTVGSTPQNKTMEMKSKHLNGSVSYAGINIANASSISGDNATSKAFALNMTQSGAAYDFVAWGADGTVASYNVINNTSIYSQTLNTDYIVGFTFQGTSSIKYFVKNTSYTDLGTQTPSGTWNYPFYLWLGFFTGASAGTTDIDDVEVDWVRVRTYASAEPSVTLSSTEEKSQGPVGYWKFDEGTGTTANDASGKGNVGTLTNMSSTPSPTSGWQTEDKCVSEKCLAFDGTDDYVDNISGATLNLTNQISVSAWVRFNTSPDSIGNPSIIDKWDWLNSKRSWALGTEGGYLATYISRDGSYENRILYKESATPPSIHGSTGHLRMMDST